MLCLYDENQESLAYRAVVRWGGGRVLLPTSCKGPESFVLSSGVWGEATTVRICDIFAFSDDFLTVVENCICSMKLYHLTYFLAFYARKQLCFQRVLAIAILSVRLSVRLSVTRVDQAKTVQARISKFSPSAAWKTSFRNRKAFS